MERDELFKRHARAMALGDGDTARTLNQDIESNDRDRHYVFVAAFFGGAITHRLGEDLDRNAVSAFAQELQQDFRDANPPLKPTVIEGCIRAIYGEDHLLDDLDIDDQIISMWAAIRKVVDQSPQMQIQLDAYLSDAIKLTSIWLESE